MTAGTLIAVLLLLLGTPCDGGRCALADTGAQARTALPLTDGAALPLTEGVPHCGAHCGLVLLPAFMVVVMPALIARVVYGFGHARLRAGAPPLLPPPQTC